MIAKLTGLLDSILANYIIINVGGVGYRVFCSTKTVGALPGVNQAVSLYIETQVREDSIRLYGFLTQAEQHLFNNLTIVQGVGAKVALAILSALSVHEIQMAVLAGDSNAFMRVSGIGSKLATRLVSELKGKLGTWETNEAISVLKPNESENQAANDALSALTKLGYGRMEAGIVIARILKEQPDILADDLIRFSLKEIGKRF